ncbi:MAG TPA: MSMEG_1061 family FMN-dependent PPOX-type flavoprotein [Gammaproteobacteria bacterium]|nr:MSMEG_1061 family FMN-dependent PPOX-type flavoprotein [Gammaproteobacteria bacterium]
MTAAEDGFSRFQDVVTSLERIREVLREPMPSVVAKQIDHIDDVCRAIIEKSPFIVIASADAKGYPDVSPKGDPQGFVRILDEKHLAIPDRPGNRRVDTFRNILENPYIAIIFLIPGKGETLRITGECRIVRDAALRESMAVKEKVPDFAVVVRVERVIIHCPKCVIRAGLWEPDSWPDSSHTPDIGAAMVAHAKLDITPEQLHDEAIRDGTTTLY